MSFKDDLVKIRRLLRDPTGKIWSDGFLLRLYNDVQNDFQHKTSILENFTVQRVPGLYQMAYQHHWEYRHLPADQSLFYQCLQQHDDGVFCYRWETQQVAGIDAAADDYGVHWTQPWEAFMGQTPGDVVRMAFPQNLRNLKFIAYDEEPISPLSRKQVTRSDTSYVTNTGEPIGFYMVDDVDNEYVLYPKPSSSWANEIDGNEGPAWYVEDDTEDAATGTIGVRIGSTGTDVEGVPLDIVDVTNNVFLIYDVNPSDMIDDWSEGDYPEFLKKYIRYGVVSRAYSANTDGRIGSLGDYWLVRYLQGVQNCQKFRSAQKRDREYVLMTKGGPSRRSYRHPRLPDTYPAVNP